MGFLRMARGCQPRQPNDRPVVGVVDVVGRPITTYTRATRTRRHTVEPDDPPQPTTHARRGRKRNTAQEISPAQAPGSLDKRAYASPINPFFTFRTYP